MTSDAQATGSPAMPPARGPVARFATGLAGSAVLGAFGGLLWGEVAPRATLRQVGPGEAAIVNAETHAFIAADAWFCGIAVVAGLLTGVLGYRYLVARQDGAATAGGQERGTRGYGGPDYGRAANVRRAVGAAGLILGALAGALLMMWLGGLVGLSGYQHTIATARNGTLFDASLSLGAKSALAFWPLVTSVVILVAEWSARRDAASTAPPAAPEPV